MYAGEYTFCRAILLVLNNRNSALRSVTIGGDEVLEVGDPRSGPAPAMCILVVSECRA